MAKMDLNGQIVPGGQCLLGTPWALQKGPISALQEEFNQETLVT